MELKAGEDMSSLRWPVASRHACHRILRRSSSAKLQAKALVLVELLQVLTPCSLSRAGLRCVRCHGNLRRRTFCATSALGDERHCVFDCPHFQSLRQQHAMIFRDSHDAMRSVMWHKDQKSVCALVLAIVNEAQTL